ncbi:radical SAM protein [Candidatus Woesearchaeota archaeon]|nr:radical SAM protein [Candidatus Woesearchaeota archaeon]
MAITILDCYTDEPSGLGVPPYLGTYPRYLYGYFKTKYPEETIYYVTIDDLRLFYKYRNKIPETKLHQKTDISVFNLTVNSPRLYQIITETSELIINLGVHVPGKYLTGTPGTIIEVSRLLTDLKISCKKILTGPAIFGTQMFGGKFFEKIPKHLFDEEKAFAFSYDEIKRYSITGAEVVKQILNYKIIEIETGKGCNVGKCSFCTEPLKAKVAYRNKDDIVAEIKALYDLGERNFRLGKQTCFYSVPNVIELLQDIRKTCPDIEILHIDNVNPIFVPTKKGEEITKAIVNYCTSGNIAAFGVESFDPVVTRENTLNCNAETAMKAIRVINKYGAERGSNGMPKFLPGINIIFGLKGETKKTHEINMEYFKKILDEGLLLRRINIRQTAIFEGTKLYEECGDKFLKKNKQYYWKWRNQIRQEIDYPMLQRVVPIGTVLHDCIAEVYDGKTTFLRQIGTYPLIVGVKERVALKKKYSVKIIGHMLRSIVGEIVKQE